MRTVPRVAAREGKLCWKVWSYLILMFANAHILTAWPCTQDDYDNVMSVTVGGCSCVIPQTEF